MKCIWIYSVDNKGCQGCLILEDKEYRDIMRICMEILLIGNRKGIASSEEKVEMLIE